MSVMLVCRPEDLSSILPKFKAVLDGFGYTAGNRYAEFRAGDRIAEIGLSALIVGGATAAAAIGGLFKKIFGKGNRNQ